MKRPIHSFLVPVDTAESYSVASESIAEVFHENTKYHRFSQHLSPILNSPEALNAMSHPSTPFRDLPRVKLPLTDRETDIGRVLRARRSFRTFTGDEITLSVLSSVLEGANGVTARAEMPDGNVLKLRASPSAGALYSVEVYLGVRHVKGLEPGLYHHNPLASELALIRKGNQEAELRRLCYDQAPVNCCSCIFLLVGHVKRICLKYGDRGYRYLLLDMGHVMQSLWLMATEMKLGFVTLGGFDDNFAAEFLPIDGREQVLGYVGVLGVPGVSQ